MDTLEVDVRKVIGRLTIPVKISHCREVSFRIWLGSKIIQLAELVIGCEIEICNKR